MCGERLVAIKEIDRPTNSLVYGLNTMVTPTLRQDDGPSVMAADFSTQVMIFRNVRRVGIDSYEFQYEYSRSNQSFAFEMTETIEFEEPTPEVNLDKLKAKVKSGADIKKLITTYLRG